jgi:hypothetical protein
MLDLIAPGPSPRVLYHPLQPARRLTLILKPHILDNILARQETGMSFKLSVRQGPRPNLVFELDQDSYTIGREAGNSIVIEDPQVSRRHASLMRQGDTYFIEDMGSTNGTYVNGRRITAPVLLANNDLIGLADTVVLVAQTSLVSGTEATVVSEHHTPPPTLPAFTPPQAQQPPVAQPAPSPLTAAQPAPPYVPPPPQYAPLPADYAAPEVPAATDKRRTVMIGVGCLALILVVCVIGFVAWSFIDCRSFSSVLPFLFPPFQC